MKLLRCAFLLSILASVLPAHAIPVTDTVVVGNQEWAQVKLFTNVSWKDINFQCPLGVCTSTSKVGVYSLEGWTWASALSVQELFNTYTGVPTSVGSSYGYRNSTWAPAFFGDFTPTRDSGWGAGYNADLEGWTATPVSDLGCVDCGRIGFMQMAPPATSYSFDSAGTSRIDDKANVSTLRGAYFVRDAELVPSPVPIPAAIWLFGSALLGLGVIKRKRA